MNFHTIIIPFVVISLKLLISETVINEKMKEFCSENYFDWIHYTGYDKNVQNFVLIRRTDEKQLNMSAKYLYKRWDISYDMMNKNITQFILSYFPCIVN